MSIFSRTEAEAMTVYSRPTSAKPQHATRPKTSRLRAVRLPSPKNRQAFKLLTIWLILQRNVTLKPPSSAVVTLRRGRRREQPCAVMLSTLDNQGTDWWADFERELAGHGI
jgi:hypothetical protein